MNNFKDVARSLEIKELCNAETEANDDDDYSTSNPVNSKEQFMRSSNLMNEEPKRDNSFKVKSKFECDLCHKTYGG